MIAMSRPLRRAWLCSLLLLAPVWLVAVQAHAEPTSDPAAGDAVSTAERQIIRRPEHTTAERAEAGGPPPAVRGPGAVAMWWPMALVLAMIGGGVLLLRRWLPQSAPFRAGPIRVLARHYLSNKQSLCLVKLGDRLLLLGVTAEQIQTVAEISDPVETAAMVAAVQRSRPDSFTSTLSRFVAEPNDARDTNTGDEIGARGPLDEARSHLHDLVGRLRGLTTARSSAEPT